MSCPAAIAGGVAAQYQFASGTGSVVFTNERSCLRLPKVIGVRFRRAGKIYYFDPGHLELDTGQDVIVETSRGLEFGEVVQPNKDVSDEEIVRP